MSFGNTTENDLLAKVFKNTALPWDSITDLHISLHTADPGEGGSQQTSEATYTGYVRIPVVRSAVGWTVVGPAVSNAALVSGGLCTVGTNVITHIAIGTLLSGAGQILASSALNSSRTIDVGDTPQFNAGSIVFTLD